MKVWLRAAAAITWAALSVPVLAASEADPWEGFNRAVFSFNETLDKYLLKPVAEGYVYVTPSPVRTGIGNFFNNIGEVTTVVNDLLQGKFRQAGLDSTRFLVNTTVGMAGFIDVGSRIGLQRNDEDFGQTLGYWGMGSGPYLMLPFLGPSTIRDAAGMVPDYFISPYDSVDDDATRYGIRGLQVVDLRASLLEVEKLVAGDRYSFFREAYLQRRAFLVRDGAMEETFLDDDELFEDDSFEDEELDDGESVEESGF